MTNTEKLKRLNKAKREIEKVIAACEKEDIVKNELLEVISLRGNLSHAMIKTKLNIICDERTKEKLLKL